LETFTCKKPLVPNPFHQDQRRRALAGLDLGAIDAPIVEIVRGFTKRTYCFTLQSCYGHFIHREQRQWNNLDPLPVSDRVATVEYRIAYLAFCIEPSGPGRDFLHDLEKIPAIDPAYIQFGCADWFWNKQVNSYVLQVEPDRFKTKDRIKVDYQEARHIEQVRNRFFIQIGKWLQLPPQ